VPRLHVALRSTGSIALVAVVTSGCVELDQSPSMQAELRSAKSELVAATKEMRAATKELQRAAEEVREPPKPPPPAAKATVAKASVAIDGADAAIVCKQWPRCDVDQAFLAKLLADAKSVTEQFSARPIRSAGKITGYRLASVKAGSVPNLLRLRSGDRVEAINGIALNDGVDFAALLKKVRAARKITAKIARGDGTVNLVISVKTA
jgi:hypothetical protein